MIYIKINKLLITILLMIMITAGCTIENDIAQENQNLLDQNQQLTAKIGLLEKEIKEKQNNIDELEKTNTELNKKLERNSTLEESQVQIIKEGLYFKPRLISPETISIQLVKNLLGEPKSIKNTIGVHGGFEESELTYDNVSITIQKQEDKELIKWMTIKDSTVVTQRGITIGSTKNQVIQAYGVNFFSESEDKISFGEKTGIRFTFKNDIVTEINIWYMYE